MQRIAPSITQDPFALETTEYMYCHINNRMVRRRKNAIAALHDLDPDPLNITSNQDAIIQMVRIAQTTPKTHEGGLIATVAPLSGPTFHIALPKYISDENRTVSIDKAILAALLNIF